MSIKDYEIITQIDFVSERGSLDTIFSLKKDIIQKQGIKIKRL